jgi:DNA invertase Pin-like site-specific DNA recombinase
MIYGYARVSTTDQDLAIQHEALIKAGAQMIPTKIEGRRELEILLEFIREGDVLVVTRIDRLARSVLDLQNIVKTLKDRGAALRCTEQPVDMTTPAEKCFLDMLGVFAEFETALRRERQMEGIAKARAEGKFGGRPPSIDSDAIRAMRKEGKKICEITQALSISRASVYRAIAEHPNQQS